MKVERVAFTVEKSYILNGVVFSIFCCIAPEDLWNLPKPQEMIYKTPGHPSEEKKKKSHFALLNSWECWLWEDAFVFFQR